MKLVVVPDDVRSIDPPQWVKSWNNIEFAGPKELYQTPLLGDSANLTIKAQAYAFSHSSGNWISNESLDKQIELGISSRDELLEAYLIAIGKFWSTGEVDEYDRLPGWKVWAPKRPE